MGHGRRMLDQRVAISQAHRQGTKRYVVHDRFAGRNPPGHLKSQHTAELFHLSRGDRVAGVGRKPRVKDPFHLGMAI